jgi:transposase
MKIRNVVIDSSSIEVNRRARRIKTDRLDAAKLLSMLMRYHGGEKGLWSVVHVPTTRQEDARHLQREIRTLKKEQTRVINRVKGLLASQGVAIKSSRGGVLTSLEDIRIWDGSPLPEGLRLKVGAEVFAREFSWRRFRNRRQVGSLAGLTPSPYQSGDSSRERGISRAGNRYVRGIAIDLAWIWLRQQPRSQLTRWYNRRFASGSPRLRKIGIIALARKLLIALWRYADFGEIPNGALLKDQNA